MALHIVLDRTIPNQVPPNLCALGIMTKAPRPGKVKTRLSPPLTPAQAAELNVCFLRDLSASIAEAARSGNARGVGVYTPAGAEASYESILPKEFLLLPQRGEEFGDRLISAAEDLLAVGFASVCLINSDSPTVPPVAFAEAAGELAKPGARLVLGPSRDGGYYLIGLKQLEPGLFQDIEWSTERVFAQTRQRAAEAGLTVHELPVGLDVDDAATLRVLVKELDAIPAEVAPATRAFIRERLTLGDQL